MLKRLGLILGASAVFLVGCEDESNWTKVESAEIIKIDSEEVCGKGCWEEKVVTLKKDNIDFKVKESIYVDFDLLYVGQIFDVYISEDYYLKKYELPLKNNLQK